MLNKYDIYLYSSNNNKFENKTAEIESCFFTDSMLNVVFKNSIDYKVYTYSKDKYILKPHANSYTFLNYLYEISKEKNNFNSEDTLLYNIYSHFINQSISQESALFSFLKTKQIKRYKLKNVLIFPFSTNKSQCEAVEKAFSSQITVIEGPPGTGKTQTILNIIANIILNNKTVAVVSNNNDAATNIYEKLSKDNLHFMCARLGNKNNKEEFIKNQSDEYPSVLKNDLNINTKEIKQKILTTYKKVLEIFDSEIKIANYNKELHDLKLEYNHFKNDKKIENNEDNMLQFSLENISKLASYKSILKYKLLIQYYAKVPLFIKLKFIFKYKFGNFKLFFGKNKLSIASIIVFLDKLYYQLKEYQLTKQIEDIENNLNSMDKNNIINQFRINSMDLFLDKLSSKYRNKKRKIYKEDALKNSNELNGFLQEYPVILSSTYSIKITLNLNDYLFDYVIIDEASQVDLLTGILALSVAKNAIIVGDSKQLPHIISDDTSNSFKKIVQELNERFNIPKEYDFINNSLLDTACYIVGDNGRTLLREHYRCHPKIINFCNKMFYNKELIICSNYDSDIPFDILKAIVTVPGNHALKSNVNKREISSAINEFIKPLHKYVDDSEIGVVIPFRNQVKQFINDIKEIEKESCIKIDTVHKFQGQEKDVVIMTTVSNDINDFINNKNLVNVAVSRAKKAFYIVTSYKVRNSNSIFKALIDYIEYNNYSVDTSKIKSIFDILYQDTDELLHEFIQTNEKKYKFLTKEYYNGSEAEKLAYFNIKEIVKNDYPLLDVRLHIPLKEIINVNAELSNPLTDEEKMFIAYDSHIDILLINTMNKQTVLAIEIDGATFHSSERQQNRDKKKDLILNKYNIPLLRLSTRDSGEIEKIYKKLSDELGY